jgi:hypothetical protein
MKKKNKTSITREESAPLQVRYSEDVTASIFGRMTEGESLRSICRSPDMPAFSTVMRWILEKPDFAAVYQIAQDIRAQNLADEIVHIADTPAPGERVKIFADGSTETVICDQVERSKLRIHAREWTLARLSPKRYGNRVMNEITGADGQALASSPARPSVEEVVTFSKELYAGYNAYRDEETGEAAPLDADNIASLSRVIADYAGGGDRHGRTLEPSAIGGAFAMATVIRKNMIPPAGFRGQDR